MFEISVLLFAVFLILWLTWRQKRISMLSNLGIPGPKPSLLFGNLLELYVKGPIKCHEEWVQKYGRVVGFYYGMEPVILIADPQLLKNILIKDFSKFTDRESFNPLNNIKFSRSVLNAGGFRWKQMRSVLTPSFTAGKLKQIAPMMNHSVDLMIQILDAKADSSETVDLMEVYQRLTLDIISKTAFGVDLNIQTEKKPSILRAAQIVMLLAYRDPFVFLGMVFPSLKRPAYRLSVICLQMFSKVASPVAILHKNLLKVLEHRKKHPHEKKCDLLQLMIDSRVTLNVANIDVKRLEARSEDDGKEVSENASDSESRITRTLTDREIVSCAVLVLLAGYHTTGNCLEFTSYLLAKNPNIQEQIYEEICDLEETEGISENATINKLPILDKVINESLRLFPPVNLLTTRFALEDVCYGSLKIPKGTLIQAPVYFLHHDPENWPDPYKFDPERFNSNPNTDGVIFLPFGAGPRNCLGMRYAKMEAKLALARIVYKYHLKLPDSKNGELKTEQKLRTLCPLEAVKIKLERRKK